MANNKGIFTISFDLELAWGTRGALQKDYVGERDVIKEILELFEKYKISATWAATGHIFLNKCEPVNGVKHPELKRKITQGKDDWLSIDPCTSFDKDPFWYGPDVIKSIKECKVNQEIGSHGFSHVWLDAPQCDREFFESDLQASIAVSKENGVIPKSFVFPQNKVGYIDVLEKEGFKIFRSEDDNWYKDFPKLLRKIGNGLDNYFVPTSRSVRAKKIGNIWSIPGSYFYIHKNSWAKFLPVSFRVQKAKVGLMRAVKKGEIFHLWTHPFNIASSSEKLLEGFEEILKFADALRNKGFLEILNMEELAEKFESAKQAVPAIVLDAEQKSSLSVVRSLGSKRVPVVSGGKRFFALSRWSKFTSQSFSYPDPLKNKSAFIDAVIDMAKKLGNKPVIYCFSDSTIVPLWERREDVEKVARMVFPSPNSFDIAFDKEKTLDIAENLRIPTPKESSQFPRVLKPRHTCYWDNDKGFQTTASFGIDKQDFDRKLSVFKGKSGEVPMIQEFIKGEEFGVEAVARNGEILGLCAHKRIRSLSPLGGASVLKETVDGGIMFTYTEKLIKELNWTGPAMVEFKHDSKTNEYKLMEINGRFWGSLPLAVFSGVDFPYIYYKLAIGEQVVKDHTFEKGVVSRYWLGDLKNLLAVLFKSDPMRKIAYPKRGEAIKNFFKQYGRKHESDVWDFDDIKPFFAEIIDRVLVIFL